MHSVVHVNLHCRVASSHLHRPRANVERDVHFKKELDFLIYMRRLAAGVKPCEYIAACATITLSPRDLAGYDESGTRRRHLPLIREALDLQPYGPPARKAFLRAMVEAARTKDRSEERR